jgi:hypothetical protein
MARKKGSGADYYIITPDGVAREIDRKGSESLEEAIKRFISEDRNGSVIDGDQIILVGRFAEYGVNIEKAPVITLKRLA